MISCWSHYIPLTLPYIDETTWNFVPSSGEIFHISNPNPLKSNHQKYFEKLSNDLFYTDKYIYIIHGNPA